MSSNFTIDPERHYNGVTGPIEHTELDESEMAIENIGWTMGNDCPYHCTHCYSMSARRKGKNLEVWMVDRIVDQLAQLGVKTVNLGGNEPIFTSGADVKKSLMPYVVESLSERGIRVGITTAGITLLKLAKHYPHILPLLNDVDVSLDSPFPEEHNRNRGAKLYPLALKALDICGKHDLDCSIIMCAMSWNWKPTHIEPLVALAKQHGAHVRINTLKPLWKEHLAILPDAKAFYDGFAQVMTMCMQVELGESLLAVAASQPASGCPCGRKSFRIHSITPEGQVPVSPCVYLHDYKVGDLLRDDIWTIVHSPQFQSFRRRHRHPEKIEGCAGCAYLQACRGGCAARSYLSHLFLTGQRSLFVKDPYCLLDYQATATHPSFHGIALQLASSKNLVHKDYLCTWIGEPL